MYNNKNTVMGYKKKSQSCEYAIVELFCMRQNANAKPIEFNTKNTSAIISVGKPK